MASKVGLADAIAQVRRDLKDAQDEGDEQEVLFSVGDVELELTVEVSKSGGGGGGVHIGVLSVGASGDVSKSDTNKIKVTLHPVDVDGEPLQVAKPRSQRPDAPED